MRKIALFVLSLSLSGQSSLQASFEYGSEFSKLMLKYYRPGEVPDFAQLKLDDGSPLVRRKVATANRVDEQEGYKRIVFIRHGEKPYDANILVLDATGWIRAEALAPFLSYNFAPFEELYAAADHSEASNHSARSISTLVPYALLHQMPIFAPVDSKASKELANYLKNSKAKNILVAWEHKRIRDVIAHLGYPEKDLPSYPDNSFDLIWTLTRHGNTQSLQQECQDLLYGDSCADSPRQKAKVVSNRSSALIASARYLTVFALGMVVGAILKHLCRASNNQHAAFSYGSFD